MAVENAPAAVAAPQTAVAPAATETVIAPAVRVDKVAEAKARILAKFAPKAEPSAAASVADKPADAKTPTAEVNADAAELHATAKLSKELRETKAKLAAIEGKAPGADKFEQASALVKAGKSHKALELLGTDIDKAVTEAMSEDPTLSASEAKDQAARDEVAALKKRLDDSDAEKAKTAKDAETAAQKAKATESEKQLQGFAKSMLDKEPGRWPLATRFDETPVEAYGEAMAASRLLMFGESPKKDDAGNDVPIRGPFTEAEAEGLFKSALDTLEAKHKERAKKYGAPEPHVRRVAESPKPREPEVRQPKPTIGGQLGATSELAPVTKGKLTHREAQKRAAERVAARARGETV